MKRFWNFSALLLTLMAISLQDTAFAAKHYVNSTTGDDVLYDGTSPTVGAGVEGPFATIQWAIDFAMPNDTVYISEGYYYGNINVNKPITLYGANKGKAGNATSRGLETILFPDMVDISRIPNNFNSVIYITSPNVVIDGLRVDGDNAGLASGTNVRGRDVDISYGVSNAGQFNNVYILNSVFENLNVSGVTFRGNVNSANTSCQVGNNLFSNFGDNSVGLELEGFYADVVNNDIRLANFGMWFKDFKSSSGRSWLVDNNRLQTLTIGIMIENCYENANPLTVQNNTITTPFSTVSDYGVYIINNRDNFKLRFTNNDVSNSGEAFHYTNNNLPPIIHDRDSIDDCDYGIRLNNFDNNMKTDTLEVRSSQFNNCNVAGIDFFNDINLIHLILKGSVFKNSSDGIILRGNCHLSPDDASFENIANNYITLDEAISGNLSSQDIDATSCRFEGFTGTAATDSMNFLTEDKIRHYLDENQYAFILFKPEHIYITTNDGNFWIAPALAKASDNWHIFIDSVNCPEDVSITKTIHFHTRGTVSIGSFIMDGIGKKLFLHGPILMSNTLTLRNGIIDATDGLPTVGQPTFAGPFNPVTGGGPTTYVEGRMRIVAVTKTLDSLYFPIGRNGDFRPLTIITEATVLGAIGTIEAELRSGPAPSLIRGKGMTHTSLVHHWRTNNIHGLAFNKVRFLGTYATFMNDDEVSSPGELRLAGEENGSWINLGGTGSTAGTGFITSSAQYTNLSYVALANAGKGSNSLGKAGPIAAFEVSQACFPDSIQFNDISSSPGSSVTSWRWEFGDGTTLSDTSLLQNPKYRYSSPGNYDVRLTITDANMETDVFNQTIQVQPSSKAGFESIIPCFPDRVSFLDTSVIDPSDPINTWSWLVDGNPYSSSFVSHNFPAKGSYNVSMTITTFNGCTSSVTKTVLQGDSVKIKISPVGPISICANDKVTLTASSGINRYQWNTGDTTASITVSSAGKYRVDGFNGQQCTAFDSVSVSVIPTPVANAGPDHNLKFGESATLAGSGGGNYDWMPAGTLSNKNIANPVAKPLKTTTYILRVFNSFGCEDFDTVVVYVEAFENVDIPNLITPNGDGHNDAWNLSILPGYESAKVSVISRWGKEVFVSFNYKNNWEGTYQDSGEPLPDGTYMYIIENKETFGVLKGSIQILR